MEEVWKDIAGYEGLYQVSNLGRVKSLKRKVYAGRNKTRWQYERIMSDKKNNGFYKVVSLQKEAKGENAYIHRLVAQTFIPNPGNLPQVNHKDENKHNNNVENLEWCSNKYNVNYGTARERAIKKQINNPKISKRILQLNENGSVIKEYPSITQAGKEMQVSYQRISDCLRGKQKHSAGYKWKYADEQN